MNNATLDDELIQEYLAESREHLTTIEADLLTMEEHGAAIDEQLVNRVFRAAHSIKGGAGFFDFHKIRELAHRAESVLEMVRCRQMVPTPELVSLLLLAFDKLRTLLAGYRQSNDADIAEFVTSLANLAASQLPAEQRPAMAQKVTLPATPAGKLVQIHALDLAQARRGGRSIYLVEYELLEDIHRRKKTPIDVLKHLAKYGTIIESGFDIEAAGTLDDDNSPRLTMEAVFATVLETDLINDVLEVAPERIHLIEKNGQTRSLGEVSGLGVLAGAVEAAPAPVMQAPVMQALVMQAPVMQAPVMQAPAAQVPAPQVPVPQVPAPQMPAATAAPAGDATIRLNVELLDSLMTLAGELVLSRNQLSDAVARDDGRGIRASAHRLSLVTSELQGAVAMTRMQPVGSLFSKFPRLVRDLGRDLEKQVQLKIEGGEVEIDKTILEGLSDPLTHMIRNSVDHGVEGPAARTAAGKAALGTVTLRASHQAGQVVIEISDDGKGLIPEKIAASCVSKGMVTREQADAMSDRDKINLIFLPGVSTAEKVSSVSGRGVGMDVVKTNLDRLGGKVEIDSVPGRGTCFRIKLPLTLAIIPSLLISGGGQRFAIPQVSVGELIRIPAAQIGERIDHAASGEVLLLRDRLVPLLHLSHALGSDALGLERAEAGQRALNIVLVDTGRFEYGLVVEELHDTVEIVVKPLGRHLQEIGDYAGATILGDGQVAIILDVAGVAARGGLGLATVASSTAPPAPTDAAQGALHSLLLFHNGPQEPCAVPIELVTRVERIEPGQVERLGGRKTMQYGQVSLPLVSLADIAHADELSESQPWVVIVFERAGRPMGLLAAEPLDMIETHVELDAETLRQPGIAGSAILDSRTTLMLDIFELAASLAGPVRPVATGSPAEAAEVRQLELAAATTVLIVEDSDFFRGQIRRLAEAAGYQVLTAPDGQAAWEMLNAHAGEIDLVATDIEMPRLDGLGLARLIRADSRFQALPIIALSSLAGEEEIARALAAGVTEYQVKLDQDEFLAGLARRLPVSAGRQR